MTLEHFIIFHPKHYGLAYSRSRLQAWSILYQLSQMPHKDCSFFREHLTQLAAISAVLDQLVHKLHVDTHVVVGKDRPKL